MEQTQPSPGAGLGAASRRTGGGALRRGARRRAGGTLARTHHPGADRRGDGAQPAARRGWREPAPPDPAARGTEDLSAALGEVTRRLNALLGEVATAPPRSPASSAQLRDTVARLGSRLDVLTAEARGSQGGGQGVPSAPGRRLDDLASSLEGMVERLSAPADPRSGRRPGVDAAVAEINARQRMLDAPPAAAAPPPPPRPGRLEADALFNLRCDIADLGRAVADLAPRHAVEALDASVRALESRVEANAPPPIDIAQLNELTRMLVEVRESVRDLHADDGLAGLTADVRGLHQRFDALDQMRLEPAVLQHLTSQVAELRTTLAQPARMPDEFAHELDQLAGKVDRIGGVLDDAAAAVDMMGALERKLDRLAETMVATAVPVGNRIDDAALIEIRDRLDRLHTALQTTARDAPLALEHKLDQLAEAIAANAVSHRSQGDAAAFAEIRDRLDRLQTALETTARNAPVAIERSILLLVDKLDRIQSLVAAGADPGSDFDALGARLDRIVEQLDRSDGRFGQLEAIERGLNDLFVHLEETRFSAIDAARAAARDLGAAPVEDLLRDVSDLRAAQRIAELKTHDTLESVHSTLERVIDRLATLEDDLVSRPVPEPVAPAALPPQAATVPPPAPAATVALPPAESAPALPPDHPLEPGSRTPIVRAGAPLPPSRGQAPQAAPSPQVLPAATAKPASEPSAKASFIAAARRAAQQAAADSVGPSAATDDVAAPVGLRAAVARHRTLILAGLVLLAAAATAPLVLPKLLPGTPNPPAVAPVVPVPEPNPSTVPGPQSRLSPADPVIARAPSSGLLSPESTAATPAPAFSAAGIPQAEPDTTAALALNAASGAPTTKRDTDLPAAIGPLGLRDAALGGDPAAMFEVATRFAEGHGVPQNYATAARWYEHAAQQGSMPAAYRLGSLYEKGEGVAKNVQLARRYYTLAADAGNTKAMHNLAVLYAEGIDGKPDYREASQLFRKAAERGLRDSQYNLAILYARGLGVDQNIGESFKWFALAANQGDADAQKKREEVAARLDAQTLLAARLAVQTWVPQAVDASANDVRPSAEWDRVDGGRARKATGRT